jgi:hypothetical protein
VIAWKFRKVIIYSVSSMNFRNVIAWKFRNRIESKPMK